MSIRAFRRANKKPRLKSKTADVVCVMQHHAPPGATRRWFRGTAEDGTEWFLIETEDTFGPWVLKRRAASSEPSSSKKRAKPALVAEVC